MKKYIYLLLIVAVAVSSCSKDDLGDIASPSDGYVLPQGGDAEADAVIQQWYDEYGSYFLYKFTEKDFQWTMVNSSTGSNVYTYTPLSNDSISSMLEVLEKSWLDFYPEDFLKEALPKRVFMCQQVLGRGVFSENYSEYPARYLMYQMAVGNPGKWGDILESERNYYRHFLNSLFLYSCYSSGKLVVPDAFFEISDYSNTDTGSRKKARNAGFVKNERTSLEWATLGNALTKADDVDAYLSSLCYRTAAQWEDDFKYDKVARKYEILKEALLEIGIDAESIAGGN